MCIVGRCLCVCKSVLYTNIACVFVCVHGVRLWRDESRTKVHVSLPIQRRHDYSVLQRPCMSVGLDPFVHPSFWNGMKCATVALHTRYKRRYDREHTLTLKGSTNNTNDGHDHDDDDDVMKYFVAMNFYAIKLLHQIHHTHTFRRRSSTTHNFVRSPRHALLYIYVLIITTLLLNFSFICWI